MLCEKCQGQLKQNDENHFVCEKCGVACPEADDAYKELDEIVNDRGDYIVTLKNGFRTIWKNVFFFRKKKEKKQVKMVLLKKTNTTMIQKKRGKEE